MRRQAPVRGVPKRGKPSLNPVKGKGRGRGRPVPLPMPPKRGKGKGKVAPPTIDTGKPGRPVPLPMPPKKGIKRPGRPVPLPMPPKRGGGKVAPLPSPIRGIKRPGGGKVAPLPMPPKRGKPKASPVEQKKLSPAALKRKRLKEKKGTPKEPFNPIDKVPGGRPDPLLRAGRKRQAKKATRTARQARRVG